MAISTKPIRLNKLIADSGLASRRKADEMIENGEVTVNGKKVFELGIQVRPFDDTIRIAGKKLPQPEPKFYYMVNKPKGVLTSTSDPKDRPLVTDLVPGVPARLFPVGRLDWDSEGLVILTNDGGLANKITHPRNEVTKTYLVKVDGQVTAAKLKKLIRGVSIEGGGKVAAKEIEPYRPQTNSKYPWFKIIIAEGKNRQLRKMFEKINCSIIKLQRVAIGQLKIGALKKGEARELTFNQIVKIFKPDHCYSPVSMADTSVNLPTKKKRAEKSSAMAGRGRSKKSKVSKSRR